MTKMKRVVSLLICLAMNISIISGIYISADAKAPYNLTQTISIEEWGEFKGEAVFTYPATGESNQPISKHYTNWYSEWEADNAVREDGSIIANINSWWNCFQVYGQKGAYASLKMPGYGAGKDFVIMEFMHSRDYANLLHEFAFKDIEGKIIETGFINRGYTENTGFHLGKTTYTFDDVPANQSDAKLVSTAWNTGSRLMFVNNSDNTYSVIHYTAGAQMTDQVGESNYRNTYQPAWESSKWVKTYEATYEGQFNGLGSIDYMITDTSDASVRHLVNFLRIYEGNVPTETSVAVHYLNENSEKIIETETVTGLLSGRSYTKTSYPEMISYDGKTYFPYANGDNLTITLAETGNEVNVKYKEGAFKDTTVDEATTRVGVLPELPENIDAERVDDTSLNVAVEWNIPDKSEFTVENSPVMVTGSIKVTEYFTGSDAVISIPVNVVEMNEYLVAHYEFEETGKNSSRDGEFDATVGSEVTYIRGVYGSAAYLPGGVGDSISENAITIDGNVIADAEITSSDAMTITSFVKRGKNNTNQWVRLFDFGNTGSGTDLFYTVPTGRTVLEGKSTIYQTNVAEVNEWMHVAITIDGTDVKVYLDGVLQGEGTFAGDFKAIGNAGDANYYIGASNWVQDPLFEGAVDDFKIFSIALTEDEVERLAEKSNVTINFVSDDEVIIKDAVTTSFFVGGGINLTDEELVPKTITYNEFDYEKNASNDEVYVVKSEENFVDITYRKLSTLIATKYVLADGTILNEKEKYYAFGDTVYDVVQDGEFYLASTDETEGYIVKSSETKSLVVEDGATYDVQEITVEIVEEYAAISDVYAHISEKSDENEEFMLYLGASGSTNIKNVDDDNVATTLRDDVGVLGSARLPLITFKKPDVEDGKAVLLKVFVKEVKGNITPWPFYGDYGWMKLAVNRVDEAVDESVSYIGRVDEFANTENLVWSLDTLYGTDSEVTISFDVTELIKSAEGGTVTFGLYAPIAGAYIVDRETAQSGTYSGKAAYLDIVDANSIIVTGATKVTKSGSEVSVASGDAEFVLTDGESIKIYNENADVVAYTDFNVDESDVVISKNICLINDSCVSITPTQDAEYYPVTIGANMVNGAQVRIGDGVNENGKVAEGSGLRFISTIDTADSLAYIVRSAYYTENENGVGEFNDGYDIGVIITAEEGNDSIKISATKWQNDYIYTTALTNLAETNFNRKFKAVPYVTIDGIDIVADSGCERSIYQVAAGLLTSDGGNENTDENTAWGTKILYKVLNAYVNQTGIRLCITKDAEGNGTGLGIYNDPNSSGTYSGNAFFEVVSTNVENDVYTITIKPVGSNTTINSYWKDYIRINNNNSKIKDYTTLTENEDSVTVTFDYGKLKNDNN